MEENKISEVGIHLPNQLKKYKIDKTTVEIRAVGNSVKIIFNKGSIIYVGYPYILVYE